MGGSETPQPPPSDKSWLQTETIGWPDWTIHLFIWPTLALIAGLAALAVWLS